MLNPSRSARRRSSRCRSSGTSFTCKVAIGMILACFLHPLHWMGGVSEVLGSKTRCSVLSCAPRVLSGHGSLSDAAAIDLVPAPALSARSECRASAARPEQGRRAVGVATRKHRVTPPDLPGPLHGRRPSVAGRVIPAVAAPPLDGGLPGHSHHDLGLAPQARLREMGLHRPPPTRRVPRPQQRSKTW
jgi:hypothetical protein